MSKRKAGAICKNKTQQHRVIPEGKRFGNYHIHQDDPKREYLKWRAEQEKCHRPSGISKHNLMETTSRAHYKGSGGECKFSDQYDEYTDPFYRDNCLPDPKKNRSGLDKLIETATPIASLIPEIGAAFTARELTKHYVDKFTGKNHIKDQEWNHSLVDPINSAVDSINSVSHYPNDTHIIYNTYNYPTPHEIQYTNKSEDHHAPLINTFPQLSANLYNDQLAQQEINQASQSEYNQSLRKKSKKSKKSKKKKKIKGGDVWEDLATGAAIGAAALGTAGLAYGAHHLYKNRNKTALSNLGPSAVLNKSRPNIKDSSHLVKNISHPSNNQVMINLKKPINVPIPYQPMVYDNAAQLTNRNKTFQQPTKKRILPSNTNNSSSYLSQRPVLAQPPPQVIQRNQFRAQMNAKFKTPHQNIPHYSAGPSHTIAAKHFQGKQS